MLRAAILILIFFIFAAPILTLLHEVGHAANPLFREQNVTIEVGNARIINFQIGKLTIELGYLKPWIGFTKWQNNSDLMALAGGPLVSLILGTAFLLFGFTYSKSNMSPLLFACAGWCLFQFMFTIIPMEYPSWLGYEQSTTSDGLKILKTLKTN